MALYIYSAQRPGQKVESKISVGPFNHSFTEKLKILNIWGFSP